MHSDRDLHSDQGIVGGDFTEPSKSARKREATALQELGERLVALSPARLEQLPLPPELHAAVRQAQGIRQRGGRKRQLQYIGKLMRCIDPEPIRAALAEGQMHALAAKTRHRQLERLCEALLSGDGSSLRDFLQHHPGADAQHLRQLIRNARREQAGDLPPHSRRALFRYLRQMV
jgi:ribosome-associated protein